MPRNSSRERLRSKKPVPWIWLCPELCLLYPRSNFFFSSTRMIEKLKKFFRKYKDKLVARLEKSPTYKKFLKQRAKLAEWMRLKLLAFFSLMSPIYNFLCIKTLDPGQPSGNEFGQVIENRSNNVLLRKYGQNVRIFSSGPLKLSDYTRFSSTVLGELWDFS